MKRLTKSFTAGAVALLLVTGAGLQAEAQRPVRGGGAGPGGIVRPGGYGGYRGSIGMRFGPPVFRPYYGGYYRPFGPRIGFYINTLPYGYFPFSWGANQFFYSNGFFYQPYGDGGYRAVNPPVGAEVPSLPFGAQSFTYEGAKYYEYNGVYYERTKNADGKKVYRVVGKNGKFGDQGTEKTNQAAPAEDSQAKPVDTPGNLNFPRLGEILDYLPDDVRKVTVSGKTYWVTPDQLYLEAAGSGKYKVVGVPEGIK
ncbi:hypothetical protein C7T94_07610 [Pedobacter yulinensis]|uniref:Uncharacterized protein n=1 Tax=Pedobacter yulinensis TaxID=2126353 RepID=A0A2T3HJH4_9SPHI|nr:DUF6515 family protein [Pedobacter yulinensis]PST82531.1 hypothetical protein C7T94_07610 [Pedobacter yulinensis]